MRRRRRRGLQGGSSPGWTRTNNPPVNSPFCISQPRRARRGSGVLSSLGRPEMRKGGQDSGKRAVTKRRGESSRGNGRAVGTRFVEARPWNDQIASILHRSACIEPHAQPPTAAPIRSKKRTATRVVSIPLVALDLVGSPPLGHGAAGRQRYRKSSLDSRIFVR
jgi:hypothetical protein